MEDQLKEIAKYSISGKMLHEGLTEDELVDAGEGKFKNLISFFCCLLPSFMKPLNAVRAVLTLHPQI